MFPRSSSEEYRSQERRRGLVYVAAGLGLLYLALSALSSLWTDYLWFDSIGYVPVWRINLLVSLGLGAFGLLLVFGFVYLNLVITDRLSPRMELLELTEEEELVERFREWAEPRLRWLRMGVAGAFGVLIGAPIAEWRPEVLQFLNPSAFGLTDPVFDIDVGFYVFRLPLWTILVNWAFNVVALTLVLVIAVHYLNGGIRLQRGSRPSIRTGVKTHVSALAALLALLRAVGYQLDRFELLYSTQGDFSGAGFTDVNARLPALQLLTLVSLAAAVLFILNIRRPGWTLAVVSIGAWLFVSVAAGAIYPSLVQRFRVDPSPLEREQNYIALSVEYTQAAYGLDQVERRDFAATRDLTYDEVQSNDLTVSNLRLWDPDILTKTYQVLQEIRPYYTLEEVDTDRYDFDGQSTQVMVAARELDEAGLPEQNWQNTRLVYTHGFGLALSPANTVEADGQPDLLVQDVPPRSDVFDLDQTRIYFGETYAPDRYVIVKTGTAPGEADFPTEQSFARSEYDGEAGVVLDSIFKRLAFAIRYRDLNILISSELRSDSRVLMERNINQIVTDIAPFLAADADPYPVILDGRVQWVIDLYTWTNSYPYSTPWSANETDRMEIRSGLPRAGGNYLRASAKAVVDAYDGSVQFYVTDGFRPDPMVATWQKAYPDLFLPESEMPEVLVEHWRYPQDMFRIQTGIYETFHVDNANDFFTGVDAWVVSPDPSTPGRTERELWGDAISETGALRPALGILPYYINIELPGDENGGLSYVLMQPFNTLDRPNMSAFLVADSTAGRYGRLVEFRMPQEQVIDGTGQVGQRISQDQEIAQQFTLWDQRGSSVIRGDMLVVPIEGSLVYVQPVYLEADQGGLPEFRRVVTVYGDRIEWDMSLDVALAKLFDAEPSTTEPEPDTGTVPDLPGNVVDLLDQASQAFADAEAALQSGDLAGYEGFVEEAQRLVEEAARLSGLSEGDAAALLQPVSFSD